MSNTHPVLETNPQLSIYRNSKDREGAVVRLDAVVDRIRGGARGLDGKTLKCRELKTDKKAYTDYKAQELPAVIFAGVLSTRDSKVELQEKMTVHSGRVVLDFDDVDVTDAFARASLAPTTELAFVSPSGDGIKVVARIDPVPALPVTPAVHKTAWSAAVEVYKELGIGEADKSGSDATRLCFLAHDSVVYYNSEAVPIAWSLAKEQKTSQQPHPSLDIDLDVLQYIPADDYDTWIKVGMALHYEGQPLSVWDSWSRSAANYEADACEKKWRSFSESGGDPVTWGTLIHWAKERGYQPKGNGRNGRQRQSKSSTYVNEPVPDALPVGKGMPQPEFPEDSIFYGNTEHFFNAYWETDETCKPYILAGALAQIGITAGRRACISLGRKPSKRRCEYPNFYQCIVGNTSISRKSTWLRQVKWDVDHADAERDILMLDSVASAEGLIDLMSRWDDGEAVKLGVGDYPEGRRVLIHPDEIKSLFLNAKRSSTSTIISRLTELYHCPSKISVNPRTAPATAYYPVVNIFGATTGEWLLDSVSVSELHGGFINRFCFWLYEFMPSKTDPIDPHAEPLQKWYRALERCRDSRSEIRNFVLSDEAWEVYEHEYSKHRQAQWDKRDSFEASASAREMTHTFKIALAFALVSNNVADDEVSAECYIAARGVAMYLSACAEYLFESAGASEAIKQERLILEKLEQLGNSAGRRELHQKIGGGRMDSETYNRRLDAMETAGIVFQDNESRPKRVVRIAE